VADRGGLEIGGGCGLDRIAGNGSWNLAPRRIGWNLMASALASGLASKDPVDIFSRATDSAMSRRKRRVYPKKPLTSSARLAISSVIASTDRWPRADSEVVPTVPEACRTAPDQGS
jgi:hypothetical protein